MTRDERASYHTPWGDKLIVWSDNSSTLFLWAPGSIPVPAEELTPEETAAQFADDPNKWMKDRR